VIPEEAVEAAVKAHGRANNPKWDHPIFGYQTFSDAQKGHLRDHARIYLEAALPLLLSHEREETRLAHIDAVVNAETASKHESAIDAVLALHRELPCLDEDGDPIGGSYCEECKDLDDHSGERVHEVYPCLTVREITAALAGEETYTAMRDGIEAGASHEE